MDDTAQPPQVGLSPPWYTLYNKIANTIGADPSFKVQPMRQEGNTYIIVIVAQDGGNPYALAAVLTLSYSMGNITVQVQVLDPSGNPIRPQLPVGTDPITAVAEAVRTALRTNPYFVEVLEPVGSLPPNFPQPPVVAVFTRSVIQFYNDDLTDYYRNFNGVTADVFNDILVTSYPGNVKLGTTTQSTRAGDGGAQDSGAQDGGAQDGGAQDGGAQDGGQG
jgi:hypothetical protein